MKKNPNKLFRIFLTVFIFLFLIFQSGESLGYQNQTQTFENLQRYLNAQQKNLQLLGGTDIGGGLSKEQILWLNQRNADLVQSYARADEHFKNTNNLKETIDILVKGLLQIYDSFSSNKPSEQGVHAFLKIGVTRGLALVEKIYVPNLLSSSQENIPEYQLIALAKGFFNYYTFLIEKVQAVDKSLGLRLLNLSPTDAPIAPQAFEQLHKQFLKLSIDQIAWVNNSFLRVSETPTFLNVFDYGNNLYLPALEVILQGIMNDLNESIWYVYHVCTIKNIEWLLQKILNIKNQITMETLTKTYRATQILIKSLESGQCLPLIL
ncbi:MAG: hypothetical protein NZ480_04945 [Bdellovibrionaceae bacterium]|nr:hypothetical protein [Pseudobdellovibrionaceae bacterium]MDW8191013.1 hypothetical protein [Pseudobdellovibrionaceae bacterium]